MVANDNKNKLPPNSGKHASDGSEGHLRYLLTAHAFGDLSKAGKEEVENHLAVCEKCRQELAELREATKSVEEALFDEDRTYVFEESRKRRVLQAAQRHASFYRSPKFLKYSVAASILLFVSLGLFGALVSDSKSTKGCANLDYVGLEAKAQKCASNQEDAAGYELSMSDVSASADTGDGVVDEVSEIKKSGNRGEAQSRTAGRTSEAKEFFKSACEPLPPSVKWLEKNNEAGKGFFGVPIEPKIAKPEPLEDAHSYERSKDKYVGPDGESLSLPRTNQRIVVQTPSPSSRNSTKTEEAQADKFLPAKTPAISNEEERRRNHALLVKEEEVQELRKKLSSETEEKTTVSTRVGKLTIGGVLQGVAEVEYGDEDCISDSPQGEKARSIIADKRDAEKHRWGSPTSTRTAREQWDVEFCGGHMTLIIDGTKVELSRDLFPKHEVGKEQMGVLELLLRGFLYRRRENPELTLKNFLIRPEPPPPPALTDEGLDEDDFLAQYATRPFVDAARDPFSTFAMDVDTASYTHARAALRAGRLPEPETVRVEEFLNYFPGQYEVPENETFGVFVEGGPAPFGGEGVELLKIGIKSRRPRPDERKSVALTFVVDASGSMVKDNRLAMVQNGLKKLAATLQPDDFLCLVAFSNKAEVILPRTPGNRRERILDAISSLHAGGATNVEAGLLLGYRLADEAYSPNAVNRVVLCGDGAANVGAKGPDELLNLVRTFAARGVDLITVGFGQESFNDKMMERLANAGNGVCLFADTQAEADRIFLDQIPARSDFLARDAKVQVHFNSAVVERYRLLGYENRAIADRDFRNDAVDAGEVGHETLVTVLYEIKRRPFSAGPLGKIFLRWKEIGYSRDRPAVERNYPLSESVLAGSEAATSAEFRFMACVAEFAELLRQNRWAADGSYSAVLARLKALPTDFRIRLEVKEVIELVEKAWELNLSEMLMAAQ
jgi:Ca-activated chloride channel family protein